MLRAAIDYRFRDRKFSEAHTSEKLGGMIDDYLRREGTHAYDAAILQTARGVESMRAGCLVQAIGGRMVRRADATTNPLQPAHGVAVEVRAGDVVLWSPMAVIWMPVPGTIANVLKELFLTGSGQATVTSPTTGYIQRVGWILDTDSEKNIHQCLISVAPGISGI